MPATTLRRARSRSSSTRRSARTTRTIRPTPPARPSWASSSITTSPSTSRLGWVSPQSRPSRPTSGHRRSISTLSTAAARSDLLRHVTWLLPSGQSIARELDVPRLSSRDFPELKSLGLDLDESTPLWYYVLREAKVMANGLTLGPVGGRIVGEVFIGLLQLDRDSTSRSATGGRRFRREAVGSRATPGRS